MSLVLVVKKKKAKQVVSSPQAIKLLARKPSITVAWGVS